MTYIDYPYWHNSLFMYSGTYRIYYIKTISRFLTLFTYN